jgi:hypothetical protein
MCKLHKPQVPAADHQQIEQMPFSKHHQSWSQLKPFPWHVHRIKGCERSTALPQTTGVSPQANTTTEEKWQRTANASNLLTGCMRLVRYSYITLLQRHQSPATATNRMYTGFVWSKPEVTPNVHLQAIPHRQSCNPYAHTPHRLAREHVWCARHVYKLVRRTASAHVPAQTPVRWKMMQTVFPKLPKPLPRCLHHT